MKFSLVRVFLTFLVVCTCLIWNVHAAPVFGPPNLFELTGPTSSSPRWHAMATGRFNSDITPDVVAISPQLGETPLVLFMSTDSSPLSTESPVTFFRNFPNATLGIERLVTVDVGPNGPDGMDDLVAVTGTGTISLAIKQAKELHRHSDLSGVSWIDDLSQSFPQFDVSGSDRRLLAPYVEAIKLNDGDNYPDLVLAGTVSDLNYENASTGLIVYKGIPNGFSSVPIHLSRVNLIVGAKFLDLDPLVPGEETLAVLEEVPPPPGYYSSQQFGYRMTFFHWDNSIGNFVLQDTAHPWGPEHDIGSYIPFKVQGFDAKDLNSDGAMDFVFITNTVSFGQSVDRGDAYIAWGNPANHRLETATFQILQGPSTWQTKHGFVSVKIQDVMGTPDDEIIVLQERIDPGTQPTPQVPPNAQVFVYESTGGWSNYPEVHDVGGVFHRETSTSSALASISPVLAQPNALQFADLNCDERPEVIVSGVMIQPSASPSTSKQGVSILPNISTPRPGASRCEHFATGSRYAIGPNQTIDPPEISLSTGRPQIGMSYFGMRISGTDPGTFAWIVSGQKSPVGPLPFSQGFSLDILPFVSSGIHVTQSRPGDPAHTASAEFAGWINPWPSLIGVVESFQWIYFSPSTGQFGTSNALELQAGN